MGDNYITTRRTFNVQLGRGAYGRVEELEVNGVVVAGKKIHNVLVDSFNPGASIIGAQFVEECKIMSRLRHPHIVQSLGVSSRRGHLSQCW